MRKIRETLINLKIKNSGNEKRKTKKGKK